MAEIIEFNLTAAPVKSVTLAAQNEITATLMAAPLVLKSLVAAKILKMTGVI